MSANGWLQFAVFSLILLASVRPVGIYLARVLEGERTWLDPVLRPVERLIYKLCGIKADKEMNWREYAFAVLGFSAATLLLTYGLERLQNFFPWNPQNLAAVGPDLAWNTAASFTTNTNWQSYTPETTMSYLTQMAGLATHNFWSAAAGIAVAVALIRGIKRTTSGTIGNFWVDCTRTFLYILLPASIIYALLLVGQGVPQNLAAVGPDLAWNTAASFITNTNWQSYVPETTMSYLTQMAGLAYHNFLSAAMGIAIAVALIRAIKRTSSATIGNFWVDTTRSLLYVLLPASIIGALLMVAQGVPQNLHAYTSAHTLEGQTQTIAQGPVASQEVIKEMGTNGGGFYNANSAHPFENPTPLSNLYEMFLIFSIGAGLTYTLGRMTGSPGHGWAVLAAMFILFSAGFTTVYWAESHPHLLIHGAAQTGTATAPAGNMEGKEVRFGVSQSSLFSTITTDASCGAVNTMHDSLTLPNCSREDRIRDGPFKCRG